MATTAGKFWYAVAALAGVGAILYGFPAGGEWFGSLVLGSLSASALLLGVLASATRDGDVAAGAAPDVAARSALPAGWPALAAVGGGVTIVGLAGGNALFYAGLGVLGVVLVEWMVQGWAERSSADPAYNSELRSRIMSPIEIPLVAVVVIGVFLASLSRVLLAVSENGSRVIAMAVATVILVIAFLIAYRPRVGSSVLGGLLALGAVVLIAVGIVSGVAGERDFGHHEADEHSGKTEPSSDTGGTTATQPGSESNSTPASNP